MCLQTYRDKVVMKLGLGVSFGGNLPEHTMRFLLQLVILKMMLLRLWRNLSFVLILKIELIFIEN